MRSSLKIGDSRVIESRESSDGLAIRRRRESPDGRRFTTYERIERPNLMVAKKDGRRESFARDKLAIAITLSVGKFFTSATEIDEIVNGLEEAIYTRGESEISSRQIGEMVLDQLALRNEVAYVRFASVYHEFKTLDEFEAFLNRRRKK